MYLVFKFISSSCSDFCHFLCPYNYQHAGVNTGDHVYVCVCVCKCDRVYVTLTWCSLLLLLLLVIVKYTINKINNCCSTPLRGVFR